jgi:uncharacterized protein
MSSGSPVLSKDGRAALFRRGPVALLVGVENVAVLRGDPETLARALDAPDDDPDDAIRAIREALAQPLASPPDARQPAVVQLNIGNTSRCNMRCSYCYNALPNKVTGRDMTPELARAAVDALLENADDLDEVALVFIGGESLLQRELLEQTVAYADRRCRARDKDLAVVVYTNGVLMDRDVIEWSNDTGVSLVVSLDGPPALHDRHRVFPSGKPTSNAVLKNIEQLVARTNQPLRRVRAVAAEREALLPLHEYLYDLGFNEIQVQAAYGPTGYEGRDEMPDLQALAAWYRSLLLAGVVISVHPIVPVLERLQLRGASILNWHPCNAGFSALGVDGDGDIYPCHHFFGEASYRFGNIRDGIPDIAARRPYFARVVDREGCRGCWARYLCGGECYHRTATGGHGYTGVVEEWCRTKRAIIEEAVDLFSVVAERRPHVLEELLDLELGIPAMNPQAYTLEDLDPYL